MSMCEEGIDYIRSLPEIRKDKGVALIGISKATEVMLSMAAFLPEGKISAVIPMNGLVSVLINDTHYQGQKVLSGHQMNLSDAIGKVVFVTDKLVNIRKLFDDFKFEGHESTIPFFSKKSIRYMFVAGTDDQNYDSVRAVSA